MPAYVATWRNPGGYAGMLESANRNMRQNLSGISEGIGTIGKSIGDYSKSQIAEDQLAQENAFKEAQFGLDERRLDETAGQNILDNLFREKQEGRLGKTAESNLKIAEAKEGREVSKEKLIREALSGVGGSDDGDGLGNLRNAAIATGDKRLSTAYDDSKRNAIREATGGFEVIGSPEDKAIGAENIARMISQDATVQEDVRSTILREQGVGGDIAAATEKYDTQKAKSNIADAKVNYIESNKQQAPEGISRMDWIRGNIDSASKTKGLTRSEIINSDRPAYIGAFDQMVLDDYSDLGNGIQAALDEAQNAPNMDTVQRAKIRATASGSATEIKKAMARLHKELMRDIPDKATRDEIIEQVMGPSSKFGAIQRQGEELGGMLVKAGIKEDAVNTAASKKKADEWYNFTKENTIIDLKSKLAGKDKGARNEAERSMEMVEEISRNNFFSQNPDAIPYLINSAKKRGLDFNETFGKDHVAKFSPEDLHTIEIDALKQFKRSQAHGLAPSYKDDKAGIEAKNAYEAHLKGLQSGKVKKSVTPKTNAPKEDSNEDTLSELAVLEKELTDEGGRYIGGRFTPVGAVTNPKYERYNELRKAAEEVESRKEAKARKEEELILLKKLRGY